MNMENCKRREFIRMSILKFASILERQQTNGQTDKKKSF